MDLQKFLDWAEPVVKVLVESTATKVDDLLFQVWLQAREEGWLNDLILHVTADTQLSGDAALKVVHMEMREDFKLADLIELIKTLVAIWKTLTDD